MTKFKIGDKAVVTFVDHKDIDEGIRVGDTVIISEANTATNWCIRENGELYPLYDSQLELVEEPKKEENAPKTGIQPMVVNITVTPTLTHITIGGKRFRLVAED